MCLKANNNVKTVTTKSCKKCIEVISKKLDVNIDDLCKKCTNQRYVISNFLHCYKSEVNRRLLYSRSR